MSFFRLTKRKTIAFVVLLLFLAIFLPVFRCVEDDVVKEKFCKAYDLCTVDRYFPLSLTISGHDEGLYCPAQSLSWTLVISVFLFQALASYGLVCVGDYFYVKYRDI